MCLTLFYENFIIFNFSYLFIFSKRFIVKYRADIPNTGNGMIKKISQISGLLAFALKTIYDNTDPITIKTHAPNCGYFHAIATLVKIDHVGIL